MKIRTNFVTNSSSVSYILTMKDEMVETYLKFYKGMFKQGEDKISEFVRKFIFENGTRVFIEDEEIFTHKIRFSTDEILLDESLKMPPEQMDFSTMDKDYLWAYIYGEYSFQGDVPLRGPTPEFRYYALE